MKVVLDTNVLVSALMNPDGPCGRLLGMAFEQIIQPCVDGRILAEYEGVLPRPAFGFDPGDVAGALDVIHAVAEALTPRPLRVDLPDPTDLAFLEVAAEAPAILVTGNSRHFPRGRRAGVTVLTPREFLDRWPQPE